MNEKTPDFSPFLARARSFVAQGRSDDAIALYGDVLQADPGNAAAYADRGTARAMRREFDLAVDDLERAFELGYADAAAYSSLATVYFEKKDFQKSLHYFAKAIETNPDYPLAYYNRSNVSYGLGDTEGAISDLKKCLEFGPEDEMRKLIQRRLDAIQSGG